MPSDATVFKTRGEQLRRRAKSDYLLIFNETNIRYLTGFTGGDGVLLVGPEGMSLLVDGRYTTQARSETNGTEVVEFKNRLEGIAGIVRDWQATRIGFESTAVSYSEYLKLQEALPMVSLQPLADKLDALRVIKTAAEIVLIKKAIGIAEKSLTDLTSLIKPGVRERELAVELECLMRRAGAEKLSFDTIVAAGPNAALPHATPGERLVAAGDFVLIDYGAVFAGYHSDETRTFIVGRPTARQRETYRLVQEAHDLALDALKEGVSCGEIDALARSFLAARGLGEYFSHGTGHGVGLEIHEAPRLSSGKTEVLEAGMVVTVEPGVYFPGEWGIRIEDMALVKKGGCELLTTPCNRLEEL